MLVVAGALGAVGAAVVAAGLEVVGPPSDDAEAGAAGDDDETLSFLSPLRLSFL